jgi:hypothetical protein
VGPERGRAWSRTKASQLRRVELPAVGDAFEFVFSSVGETQTSAGYEVFHGAGHEHFGWTREGGDAGSHVYRDPAEVVAAHFTFAGVQSRSYLEQSCKLVRKPPSQVDFPDNTNIKNDHNTLA